MLIFGTRQKGEIAGFAPGRCNLCGPTVVGVIQRTKKFTLYFIPVLTYGKDSTALCATCGSECYLREGTTLYATQHAALGALAWDQEMPRGLPNESVAPPRIPRYRTPAKDARLPKPSWMTFWGPTPEVALMRAEEFAARHNAEHGTHIVEAAWLDRPDPTVGIAWGDSSREYASVFEGDIPIAWPPRRDRGDEVAQDEEQVSVSGPETKRCPDCAESVLAEARICRFCRYEFRPALEVA